MTSLDKFFSDIDRLARGAGGNDSVRLEKTCAELSSLFAAELARCPGITRALAEDVASFWKEKYAPLFCAPDSDEAQRKDAALWLGNCAALFSGEFEPDMDFPREDWSELSAAVSAEAEEMDVDALSQIMSVFVERGVL